MVNFWFRFFLLHVKKIQKFTSIKRMGKEDAEIQAIFDLEKKNGSTILYVGVVRKLHDSGKGGDARNLVITTNKIEYYKGKKPNRKFAFIDVSTIKRVNEPKSNRVEIYFNQDTKDASQIRFESPDIDNIYSIILSLLCRSHAPDKVPKMGIEQTDINKYQYSATTCNIGYLNLLTKMHKVHQNDNANKAVYYMLSTNAKEVFFPPDMQIHEILFAIMFVFAFKRNSSSIIFNEMNPSKSIYNEIVKFMMKRGLHYRHINFSIPADSHFNELVPLLEKDDVFTNCYTFANTNFNADQLKLVHELCSKKHIRTINFFNAFPESELQYIQNEFFTEDIAETLLMLSVDKLLISHISEIIPKLPNIYILSVAASGMEIGEALTKLSELNLNNLRYLNLSANPCTTMPEHINFPQLERLELAYINFEGETFTHLLGVLEKIELPNGLSLHLDMSTIPEFEFNSEKCDKFKELTVGPILAPKLMEFVYACNKLESLSIDFGVNEANKEIYAQFIEKLPEMTHLKTLSIMNSVLAEEDKIFEVLGQLKFLEKLRIFNIKIADRGVEILTQLMTESESIKEISFDRIGIENIENIEKMTTAASTMERHVLIILPLSDISELLAKFPDWKSRIEMIKKQVTVASGASLPVYSRILTQEQYDELKDVKEWARSADSPLLPINFYDDTPVTTIDFAWPQFITKEMMDEWGIEDKYEIKIEEPQPIEQPEENKEEEKSHSSFSSSSSSKKKEEEKKDEEVVEDKKEEIHEEKVEEKVVEKHEEVVEKHEEVVEKHEEVVVVKKEEIIEEKKEPKKSIFSTSDEEDEKKPAPKKLSSDSEEDIIKTAPKKFSTDSDDEVKPQKKSSSPKRKLNMSSDSDEEFVKPPPKKIETSSDSDEDLKLKKPEPKRKSFMESSDEDDIKPPPKKPEPKKIETSSDDEEIKPPPKKVETSSSDDEEVKPPPKKVEQKRKSFMDSSDDEENIKPPPKKFEPKKILVSSDSEEDIKPPPKKLETSSESSENEIKPPPKKPEPKKIETSSDEEDIKPPPKKVETSSDEGEDFKLPPKKPEPKKIETSSDEEDVKPPPKKPEPKIKSFMESSDNEDIKQPPKKPEPKKVETSSDDEEDFKLPPKKPEPKRKSFMESSDEEDIKPPPKKPEPKIVEISSSDEEDLKPPPKKVETSSSSSESEEFKMPPNKLPSKAFETSSEDEQPAPPPVRKPSPVKKPEPKKESSESSEDEKPVPPKKKSFFDTSSESDEPAPPPARKQSPAKPAPKKPEPKKSSSSSSEDEKPAPVKKFMDSSSSSEDGKPAPKPVPKPSPAKRTISPAKPSPKASPAKRAPSPQKKLESSSESDDPDDVMYTQPDWEFPITVDPVHTQATTNRIDAKFSLEKVLQNLKST